MSGIFLHEAETHCLFSKTIMKINCAFSFQEFFLILHFVDGYCYICYLFPLSAMIQNQDIRATGCGRVLHNFVYSLPKATFFHKLTFGYMEHTAELQSAVGWLNHS